MRQVTFSAVVMLFLFPIDSTFAQVEVNKPIQLTGGSGESKITGLEDVPIDDFDAANKKYVDDQVSSNSGGAGHYIGEQFGGGIVFEVFKDIDGEEHGLVVMLNNLNAGRTWSGTTNVSVPASGAVSVWNGLANSNAIQTQNNNSAAGNCRGSSTEGFNDWFLPSISQLRLLWTHNYVVNKSITAAGGTQIVGRIWSSSETASTHARFLNLSTDIGNAHYGDIYPIEKTQVYIVRCIREY